MAGSLPSSEPPPSEATTASQDVRNESDSPVPTSQYASSSAAAPPTRIIPFDDLTSGATVTLTPSASADGSGDGTPYTMYTGDGQSGWPSLSDWTDFRSLWKANLPLMKGSCAAWDVANNSDDENNNIKVAIQRIAASSGVDQRFIFAIIMQESKGCVRVPTTVGSVANPGLMQSHEGTGTCNDHGDISNPCSGAEITQMVNDGTVGTPFGDGLKALVSQHGDSDAIAYYRAARCYNSGSIAPSGDLGQGVATHCYVSDIANRLTGWTMAASRCYLDGQEV